MAKSEEIAKNVQLPALPLRDQLGYDTQRTWVTGFQIFANPNHVLLVLREQSVQLTDEGEPIVEVRNVGSLVMPTDTALQLRDLLAKTLEPLDPITKD